MMLLCALLLQATPLKVDPRLLAQAAEAWSVVATEENPVWPGWNAIDTPMLFYFPGEQDVLVNHPSPPRGFEPYRGPELVPGWDVQLRNGETAISLDGQNTTRSIGGVQTLIVADTMSNKRQNLEPLLGDPDAQLNLSNLTADPYSQIGMIAHEAFHAHQEVWGAAKRASEGWILSYPVLEVDNEVAIALEGELLYEALELIESSAEVAAIEQAAMNWLSLRLDRHSHMETRAVDYEHGTEFSEGLAMYVEYRLTQALEGRHPGPGMSWVRGFAGYDDLSSEREALRESVRGFLTGERIVNGDPYGTGIVRYRLYYSGMAIGVLLDELMPDWKQRMKEAASTLTGLVQEALSPTVEEMGSALAMALEHSRLPDLVDEKTRLHEEGRRLAEERVEAILAEREGDAGLVTIDYSALGQEPLAWGYTSFGLTLVDSDRTIYGAVPISTQFADGSGFEQSLVSPVLHDRERGVLCFRPKVTPEELLEEGPVSGRALQLGGATLTVRRADLRREGTNLIVELRKQE